MVYLLLAGIIATVFAAVVWFTLVLFVLWLKEREDK